MNDEYANTACQECGEPFRDYTTGRTICVGCLAEYSDKVDTS